MMQYYNCQNCIHKGNVCQMVMAQAMRLLGDIQYLVEYSQTRETEHKCALLIDYDCGNFRGKDEVDAE